MGGGCQSPVAAYAEPLGGNIRMRALSFATGPLRRAQAVRPIPEAIELGAQLAAELKG
jgi:porphobilinogen deaminase